MRLFLAAALAAVPWAAQAQDDPNLAHPHRVITVQRDGYAISALATHLPDAKAFKYGIALFPGHPGILRLREEGARPRFELGGSFLVRSRRHWLDEETLVLVVDAPSDHWDSFRQEFRESPRYGADIAALLTRAARDFGIADWTFVGTSEGSVSAFHAARMNPILARRLILTSSLFQPTANGPGLSTARWQDLRTALLWVHHEHDPCALTLYGDAERYARRTGAPLITVHGGNPGKGATCQAFTAHGFAGVERETVRAMRAWVRTGATPALVTP
jgi:pimeloyl-ACP methyl ester carboxylesterase